MSDDGKPGLLAVMAGAVLGGFIAACVIVAFGWSLWWLLAGWLFAIGCGVGMGRLATWRWERR